MRLLKRMFLRLRYALVLMELGCGISSQGCSEDEIQWLEQTCQVDLPEDYKSFLRVAGKGAESVWVGSDYVYNELPDMQVAGKALLKETGLSLPAGAFVFHMHQGYVFSFIDECGVHVYLEGDSEWEKKCPSFSEFFLATYAH